MACPTLMTSHEESLVAAPPPPPAPAALTALAFPYFIPFHLLSTTNS